METRAEEFRTAAEEKLRVELEKGLITEEDLEAEAELKRAEEEAELEGQDTRIDRRQAWMDALSSAKGQMPGTASGATPALGQPRGGLGSLARPGGLGSPSTPSDEDAPRTLAAPVRAPVQSTGGLGAAPAATPPSGGLAALKPVRQPIKSSVPQTETPSPEPEPMSEEEFDTEPEPSVEEKPSLTQTILDAISETDDDSPPAETPSDESETPDFAEVAKPSRGPPGGGRLIREGAPEKPAQGPPTRGPPGIESETPSEEDEEADLPTLTPVLRPVLQPATRTVLTPIDEEDESEEDEVTVLKPIGRAVLKPVASPTTDEEE